MDPDARWQGSQETAARKAVETTDAAWPDDGYGGGGKKFSLVLPSP
jgi:hypothetical protein